MMRLIVFLWVGLGVGCIEAPPQSLPDIEDMATVDLGSDEGQSDTGVPPPEEPSCMDEVQNQEETSIDCGGPNCGACSLGSGCEIDSDCVSARCEVGVCAVQDECMVSEMVSAQDAYDAGCTSIKFPEGEFTIGFEIERSVELSGDHRDRTKLAKVLFRGSTDQESFLINQVQFDGLTDGAIDHRGGKLRVVDVLFMGNSTDVRGGAIFSEGTSEGQLELVNCEFRSNTAQQGGAVYVHYPPDADLVTIMDSVFTSNSASGENAAGGAIYVDGASVTIWDSTFTGNHVEQGQQTLSGGAIHVAGLGVGALRMRRATFVQNQIDANQLAEGGAISIRKQNLEIAESYFMENRVVGNSGIGGAIAAVDTSISVIHSTFRSNTAVGTQGISRGAAIHGQGVSEALILINSTLSAQNMDGADPEGSALYLAGMAFESYSNTFSENAGESVIVGPQNTGVESLTITDNTIYGDLMGPNFPDAMAWSGRNIIAEQIDPEGKFNVGDPGLSGIQDIDGMWVHVPMVGSLPRTLAGPCAGPRQALHLDQDQLGQFRPLGLCTVGAVQVFEVE